MTGRHEAEPDPAADHAAEDYDLRPLVESVSRLTEPVSHDPRRLARLIAMLIADGGGIVATVRQPVVGTKKIVNLLCGFSRVAPTALVEQILLNGSPGVRVLLDGAVDTVIGFTFEHARISRVYAVRNPAKLCRLTEVTPLSR